MIGFFTSAAERESQIWSRIRFLTSAPRGRGFRLTSAIMNRVRLAAVERYGANYRYADLAYIPLREVDLKKAKMMHADLRFTDLTGADLRGANLSGADITGAELTGVLVDNSTILPAGYAVEDGRVVQVVTIG